MAVHHVTLHLSDEQEEFIKRLIAYDRKHHAIRYTPNQELAMLAKVELREMMELFEREKVFEEE